jgi:PRTRC genetic system protein C
MKVEKAVRAFTYNKIPLQDPDPKMSIEEVRTFYLNLYPELTNAEIEGPEQKDNTLLYTFRKAVGTKGAALSLRDRLNQILAGTAPKPRGNVLAPAELDVASPLAPSCMRLAMVSTIEDGERVPAPSEALPVLP